MYTRILTYDLKSASSKDYVELYDYFKKVNASKITESSYMIKTDDAWDDFKAKIFKLTKSGDNVQIVVRMEDSIEVRKIR